MSSSGREHADEPSGDDRPANENRPADERPAGKPRRRRRRQDDPALKQFEREELRRRTSWRRRSRLLIFSVATIVLVVVTGFVLPASWSNVRTTILEAPPEQVFAAAVDVDRFAEWRSDLRQIEVERRGDLWAWTERPHSGPAVKLEQVALEPGARYQFKYETARGLSGERVLEFARAADGRTKLTLTETVTAVNPLVRVGARALLNLNTASDAYFSMLNYRLMRQAEEAERAAAAQAKPPTAAPDAEPAPTPSAAPPASPE